ncbi:MAG: hypothetical protein U9N45_02775, partial [Gemmatimonadota bacterium]|nr:hypothetical protein [Gemmatimonadota bacterium]
YGCTVCHHGAAVELSAEKAHGPDHLGRPFWGGKLALRSCGLCHAGRSPVIFYAAGFVWPKSCSVCHEIDRLSAWEADSSLFASRWFPVDEMKLRDWLLRHWGEKVGRVPERDTFEEVVALMAAQSADTTEIKAARDHGPAIVAEDGKTVLLKCPSCGRTFGVAGHSEEYFCPADGSMLEQIIQTAQKD